MAGREHFGTVEEFAEEAVRILTNVLKFGIMAILVIHCDVAID